MRVNRSLKLVGRLCTPAKTDCNLRLCLWISYPHGGMYKQTKWLNWAEIWPFGREAVPKRYQLFFNETRTMSFHKILQHGSFSFIWPKCKLELLWNGSFQGLGPPSPTLTHPYIHSPLSHILQIQKEKSVAIHVIIVKTMIGAK